MIGAIVSAAASLASGIAGGIMKAKAARKRKQALNKQLSDNQNWYNRRYNEDATQRADAQSLLRRTEESIRNRNQEAAGTQAVIGGTDEAVAAAKESNNKAIADAVGQISAAADTRKDQIEQTYMQNKQGLESKLAGLEAERANNIATATSNAISAAGQLGTAISDFTSAKKEKSSDSNDDKKSASSTTHTL